MLEYSGSGDAYGNENYYINFDESGIGEDLADMVDRLQELESIMKEGD